MSPHLRSGVRVQHRQQFIATSFLGALCGVLLAGCGGDSDNAGSEAQAASANYAVGRITFADGKPLTGDIGDITVVITGVSEAGERIEYTPIVKNGQYKQKLVPGQFRFGRSAVTVRFEGKEFQLTLEPVGKVWSKSQDAAVGIVQDFVWKPTGQTETYGAKADPNNHTHWYGMNVGMRFSTYREDIQASPPRPSAGTKLTFTLTPISTSIDGRTLQPIVFEREWRPSDVLPNDDPNDIPPANYELLESRRYPTAVPSPSYSKAPATTRTT